jgi:hypothetical protein
MLRAKFVQLDAPGPPPCSSLVVADAGLVVMQLERPA